MVMSVKTGYSFRDAIGSIDDVIKRLKDMGAQHAPIADRASTFAYVRWNKACKKAGLHPVFGVELAVTESVHEKKPVVDHWQFFAIDDIEPVNRLVMLATQQFRYEPLLTYEDALNATGVIKVAGSYSRIEKLPVGENCYVGLRPSVTRGYFKAAQERGVKWFAASDAKFPNPEDYPLYEIMIPRAGAQTYPQHMLTEAEWRDSAARWLTFADEAWDKAQAAWARCAGRLPRAEIYEPARPATLEAMCVAGARKLNVDLSDPVYAARLERELRLIKEKDFEDYFYIIADMMQWSRAQMVCGPARGSSCGSLVCYLLEITTIDPIPHGLIFERFIDINRNDLPDIDIDFQDDKRNLVFEYMEKKYGRDHVARLGTVALFRPKSAVDVTGFALGAPKYLCNRALDGLIVRASGDARAMSTLEDTLLTTVNGKALLEKHPEMIVAGKLEGAPRHYSQHAAGIVLTKDPVIKFVAIDAQTGGTHCDKKDAEELNLLKIDALGLTQLSIFADCLALIGKPHDWLDSVPLDDPNAFRIINEQRYTGLFQFTGPALPGIAKQVKIECLEDIVAITSLARPGPQGAGGTGQWVRRKTGQEPVTYPHPIFEPYLKETLGVVAYQEQVMEIGRNIGDLTWEDVTALRKAMSKSLGKEYFDQFGDRFKAGAAKKGIDPSTLDKLWNDLCAFGGWAFNKSHSVAYGIVSYWCAYLKAYHPVEFAAATLSHCDDEQRMVQILREMRAEGIDYVPVDVEHSTDKWNVMTQADGKRVLVGPLGLVNGIGPKAVQAVLGARKRSEPIPERYGKLLNKPKTKIDSLTPIADAFRRVLPDPATRNITSEITPLNKVVFERRDKEYVCFVVFKAINLRDENEAVNVAKRGGTVYRDNTWSLNLQMMDDSGMLFGKVNRFAYARIGKEIVERGRPGKALYAVKGTVPPGDFKMLSINMVRYIGDADEAFGAKQSAGGKHVKLDAGEQ